MTTSPDIRVGVVEDNAGFRKGLQAVLELTPGIDCVVQYGSASEAVRDVQVHTPDVILMDLNLPRVSGIECTREIKRLLPKLHV